MLNESSQLESITKEYSEKCEQSPNQEYQNAKQMAATFTNSNKGEYTDNSNSNIRIN